MSRLQEIRRSYPQYSDLSDEQLLTGLHQRFYSDMPFEDFTARIGQAPAQPQVAPGSGSSLLRGVDELQGSLYSAAEGAGRMTGIGRLEQFGREGRVRNELEAEQSLPESERMSFGQAEGVRQNLRAAGQALGSSLPSAAPGLAGALGGAALGSAILPGPGSIIGGVLGGAAASIPQFFGANRQRQIQESGEVQSEGRALAAALPQAASEGVVDRLTLGLGRILGVGGETVAREVLPRIATGIGVGAASNVPAEVFQQAIERAQAGLDVLGPEAMAEYREAATAAAVVGGTMGGTIAGVFGSRPAPPPSDERPELQQAIQDIVGAREPEPTLAIGSDPVIETPVGDMRRTQFIQYMERRLPEMAEADPQVASLLEYTRNQPEEEQIQIFRGLLDQEQQRLVDARQRSEEALIASAPPEFQAVPIEDLPTRADGAPLSKTEFEALRVRERATKPVTLEDLESRDLAEARGTPEAKSVEELIKDFKRGRAKPKAEKSLTQFIVEQGGIRDERGEVRNMLGNNLRSRPGLLSNKGLPLDRMAEAAREAGYFDDMQQAGLFVNEGRAWQAGENLDPLDARAFMNALEEDFSGRNRRFGRTEDVAGRERQDALADLDEYLRSQGTDIDAPLPDILRTLRRQNPDAPGLSLDELIEADRAYAWYQDAVAAKKAKRGRRPAAPTEAPVAAELVAAAPAGPRVTGFTTAQGSTYQVNDQGQTIRTKRSPGRGQGTTYEPFNALYVDPAEAADIMEELRDGGNYRFVVEDGNEPRVIEADESLSGKRAALALFSRTGEFVRYVPTQGQPAVGLSPVELLYSTDPDGNRISRKHIGNPIVSLQTEAPPTQSVSFSARVPAGATQTQAEQTIEQAAPNQEKAGQLVKQYLSELKAEGRQGRLIAKDLETLLNNRQFDANQIYQAFTIAKTLTKTMPGNADYRLKFLPDLIISKKQAEAAQASGAKAGDKAQAYVTYPIESLPGFIEISLAPDMLPYLRETAAHEAFHVLQTYFGQYDKTFADRINKFFRNDMTIADLEPSIKRRLMGLKAPGTNQSYYDSLVEGLGDAKLSASEAQAYAFGSLVDAMNRGQRVTALIPSFQRFTVFARNFFNTMKRALTGDGFTSPADILTQAQQRGRVMEQAAPKGVGQQFSARSVPDTINVDGVNRPATNSEGRPIHPTEEGIRNFWRWFGDSKVVDAKGKPLVVYHGTSSDTDFSSFKMKDRGVWFADSPVEASNYAQENDSMGVTFSYQTGKYERKNTASRVIPAYISIQNPRSLTEVENKQLQFASNYAKAQAAVFRGIASEGYDGVDIGDGIWVVLKDASKIKSATGNAGSFKVGEKKIQFSARRVPSGVAGLAPIGQRVPASKSPLANDPQYRELTERLTGKELDKPSVLTDGLKGFIAKQPGVRRFLGALPGEKLSSAFVRNTINQAAPGWMLDRLVKEKGLTAPSVGMAMEVALTNTGRIEMYLKHGPLGYNAKTGDVSIREDVPGLLPIVKGRLNPKDKKQAQAYFIALRERDLSKAGKKGFLNLSDAEMNRIIQAAENAHPEWKEVAADLQKLNKALLDFAVDTGTLDRAKADELGDMFYTPFYRQADDDANKDADSVIGPRLSNSMVNVKTAFDTSLKGGENPLGDLFENIIRNADVVMKAGMKNIAMRTAADVTEMMQIGRKVKEKIPGKTITYRVDGKDQHFELDDPVFYAALAGAPKQFTGGIYDTMANMASFFRDMVTSAPSFMLANVWRGKVMAYVQEGSPFMTNTFNGIKQGLMGSVSTRAIASQTGFGGYTYGMGDRDYAKTFEREIGGLGYGPVDMLRRAMKPLQIASEASEMAERVKLYERMKAQGMTDKQAAFQAYLLAPFSRRGQGQGWLGTSVSWLIPLVPFLNAKIQGMYRLFENEKGDTQKLWTMGLPKQILGRGLVVMGMSLALAAYNMGDEPERWDNENPDLKFRYDIIYLPGGNRILLPRAFEVGSIFGALPVFALDAIRKNESRDLGKILADIGTSTFFFNPMPQAVTPLIGAVANYDFFRGRALEGPGEQGKLPEERVNRSTSTVARMIGETLGVSPIRAQYLIEGYSGSIGTSVLAGFDTLLGLFGVVPSKPAGAFGDPAGVPAIIAGLTGANRFFRNDDQAATRFISDFYKFKEMTDQLVRSRNMAAESGDYARLQELSGEAGLPLTIRPMVTRANTQITEINKRIRRIEQSDLDSVSKAEALRPLREIRDSVARNVVERARDVGAL